MIRRPPRSTRKESSAASDVYKRQQEQADGRLQVGAQAPAVLLEGDDGWWLHGWIIV